MKRLALLLVAGCINFDDARAKFCMHNPGAVDCASGGGSAASGGGATDGGGTAMGGGAGATGGGTAATGGGGGLPSGDAGIPRCAGTDTSCRGIPDGGPGDAGLFDAGSGSGTYYVDSDAGSDSNNGSNQTPWQSVDHAIATAPPGSEIHVCQGTYAMKTVINKTLYLRGSYECSTFARTSTYGWNGPFGGFDHAQPTRLVATTGSCDGKYVLDITAGAPVLDGFSIEGAAQCSSYAHTPFAVQIEGSAAPRIINCEITGGDGGANVVGSGAVAVFGDGGTELAFNRINGGGGASSGGRQGSVGVLLDQNPGPSYIHDNVISGGAGQALGSCSISPFGSVAIEVFNGPPDVPLTIERNWLSGGSGKVSGPPCIGSGGVYLDFSLHQPVNVVDNFIEGGSGSSMGAGAWWAAAVFDNAESRTVIARNAIAAGDGPAVGMVLDVGNVGVFDVKNNMIHCGNRLGTGSEVSTGLRISGVHGGTVIHNTFVMESQSSAATLASVDTSGNPSTLTDVFFVNNLFLGAAPGSPAAITLENTEMVSQFTSNGFTGNGDLMQIGATSYSTPQALEGVLENAGQSAVFNFQLTPSCSDGGAIDCSGDGGCVGGVIDWAAGDRGYGALLSRAGWPLAQGTACRAMKSLTNLGSALIADDFYGRPRTTAPSVGAAEMFCGCR
jgi:hypothetical protein